MYFKQFDLKIKETLCETQIQSESVFHGYSIIKSANGEIFIDYKSTSLSSIEEAKDHILKLHLEEEISKTIYEDIPDIKIANIIREHHDIKVTERLIESYLELASSKTFSIDPVVLEIRSFNSVSSVLNNKIDFILNDGSTVAISENTFDMLSTLLDDKYQLIEYMCESKSNFIRVVKELS